MPYVIGQASTIEISGGGLDPWQGITSFSYNEGKSVNPLFQLSNSLGGPASLYAAESPSQPSANFSLYSGSNAGALDFTNSGEYSDLSIPTDCTDSPLTVTITFTPGLCPSSTFDSDDFSLVSEEFFVTSYSFSKDAAGFGTESWSVQKKPSNSYIIDPGPGSFSSFVGGTVITPTVDIRMVHGIPSFTASGDFDIGTDLDLAGVSASVFQQEELVNKEVSAQAGPLSISNANVNYTGFTTSFGGSQLFRKDGTSLNVSVSIPMNPIYLEVS